MIQLRTWGVGKEKQGEMKERSPLFVVTKKILVFTVVSCLIELWSQTFQLLPDTQQVSVIIDGLYQSFWSPP